MSFRGHRVLGVVPARGGSKAIPRKNLRDVAGSTLLARTAAVVRSTVEIDRAVLSTDDPEIAAAGRDCGLEVPFLRPAELATDTARSVDAWRHAWIAAEREWEESFDLSVLLEPTCPLRRPADIVETLARMIDSGAWAAATVSPTPGHFTPHKALSLDTQGRIGFFLEDGAAYSRRQDIPKLYHRNGACYAARRDTIVEHSSILEKNCVAVVIERPMVNIDEPLDLELASFLLSRQNGGKR